MTRRELREHIAQMLFGVEFHEKDDIEEQKDTFKKFPKEKKIKRTNLCPVCGETLIFEGGCNVCKSCGWSKCE